MYQVPSWTRPLAVCVFRRDDLIFVMEGYDSKKDEVFYRPLGGSIEFGEYSHQTVKREIKEEIGEEVTNLKYLGTIENIFTYLGQPGHEIVLIYEGDFVGTSIYEKEWVQGHENGGATFKALWKAIAEFRDGKAPLYPEGILELITKP